MKYLINITLFFAFLLSNCSSFFWYSPITKRETLEDCLLMQETKSPFYPSYCDRLLHIYNYGPNPGGMSTEAPVLITKGWGWSEWTPWIDDGCPEICGRRCRIRSRSCAGDFKVACEGKGKTYELDDCPALMEGSMDDMDKDPPRRPSSDNDDKSEENNDENSLGSQRDEDDNSSERPENFMKVKQVRPTKRRKLRAKRKKPEKQT